MKQILLAAAAAAAMLAIATVIPAFAKMDAYTLCEAQWELRGHADATSNATMTQAQFDFLKKCMRRRGEDFWI
jgi:hypothetical protein